MKVLVNEIERVDLINIMHYFVSNNEIVILEDALPEYKTMDCNQPYYIEEKIKHTHWHPQDFFEASDDLDKFMSNIEIFELK